MSNLTRWEPFQTRWNSFKELEQMEQRLATLFGHRVAKSDGEETLTTAEWAPLVDISEDEKEYVIKAELPEVKKEDVKVTVHDNVLSLSGERKSEKEEKGKKYHRIERTYGSFQRSFALPDDADGPQFTAEYNDGVLKVHLPKSEKVKPKTIDIKIS